MVNHNDDVVDKSLDPDFKLEFYKWRLALEKNFLEREFFLEGTVNADDIDHIYKKISNVYEDLSSFIDAAIKKCENEKEKQVLLNKLNLYKALSLHFSYSNILFQARFMQRHKEKDLDKVLKLLEEFGQELF